MKSFISTILCVCLLGLNVPVNAETMNPGYFRLNTNPENPNRMPNWETEEGVVLSKDSPVIVIGGANGKRSTGKLPAGVLVMTDKTTGNASWVAICGNTHLEPIGWKPEGKKITAVFYQRACDEMAEVLLRLERLQEGINTLLARPYSSLTKEEVKVIVDEAMPKTSGSWCGIIRTNAGCNWGLVGIAAVIGGIALAGGGGKKDKKLMGDGNTIP